VQLFASEDQTGFVDAESRRPAAGQDDPEGSSGLRHFLIVWGHQGLLRFPSRTAVGEEPGETLLAPGGGKGPRALIRYRPGFDSLNSAPYDFAEARLNCLLEETSRMHPTSNSRPVRFLVLFSIIAFGFGLTSGSLLAQDESAAGTAVVEMTTNYGKIKIELNREKAPETVENFLKYARDGFYENTVFHRVIKDFMIQGGGFDVDLNKKPTRLPVNNEADNGLSNQRGTIAMARTQDPHSATAQFFISTVDNSQMLDHTKKTPTGWGYAVFGKVISGMEVVDAIAAVATAPKGPHGDVPVETVLIEKVEILEE
jgi:peptidyl-prolyl cis-trans isomerase B (cyclophilin B)